MAKKTTMAQKIVKLMEEKPLLTAAEVAEKLGTKTQYVNSVIYLQRKKAGSSPRKPGRPKKSVTMVVPAGVAVEFNNAQAETIRSLRKEIDELTVVIAYLEHRCSRAENRRGVAV